MRVAQQLPILVALTLTSLAACGDEDGAGSSPSPASAELTEVADESPSTSAQGSSVAASVCPPEGCEIEEARRVPYVEDATFVESVDVFSPVEPGPWPVVVLAHGILRDRSDVEPWAREVASRGAVAVTVGYPDDPPFVEAIEHLGCSVRFARSIAEDHGGDPANVTFVGHSLGAATGAVVALDNDLSTDGCLATDGSTAPEALVGYEGPYDLATTSNEAFDLASLETSDPDVWRAVNPYSNIGQHPGLVIRLIHGIDQDENWYDVAPEVSQNFHRALLDAGHDAELVMIDGATHGAISSGSIGFDETIAEIIEVAHT